ncbi:primosome assembly protein PriA, partial [gut metagenome]
GLCVQMDSGKPSVALLHGVTASGKTLVFLKLVEHVLELGKTALILVPEISLTPQMIRRIKEHFGSKVAVQHSALNHTERLLQWNMIQKGGARIVVGTRSAVFAPLQNIGLIVIDEEQERTYRSENAPRFDAREVAKRRVVDHRAMLLLASATPSVESYQAALQGRYTLYRLTQRYSNQPLPSVEMVDMRAELSAGNAGSISTRLAQLIQQNLQNQRQTILLLNRRGYQTIAMCSECGQVLKCVSCSVPMVYHKKEGQLLCHYCGKTIAPPPDRCPHCGGRLRYTGFGTQRVEEELESLFPKARILRMDQDSTCKKNAHETMLAHFAAGEYDIMLGTQMV